MTPANPLLADTPLPAFSQIRPEHVVPAIEAILADYGARIHELADENARRDFDTLMLEQERLEQRLARAWAPVSHLHAVADSPALREAYGNALERITDFTSELGQNRALYAAVRELSGSPGFRRVARRAARDGRACAARFQAFRRGAGRAGAYALSRNRQ